MIMIKAWNLVKEFSLIQQMDASLIKISSTITYHHLSHQDNELDQGEPDILRPITLPKLVALIELDALELPGDTR